MNARIRELLTASVDERTTIPADEQERRELLAAWQRQSAHIKSHTLLQCPPQSWIEKFAELPPDQRNFETNPCVNTAIKDHEKAAVTPFRMQATTVTRGMYHHFDPAFESSDVLGVGQVTVKQKMAEYSSPFAEHSESPLFPIIATNWFDAWVFCKWLGPEYRLPRELEWEHACRAGTTSDYHFGNGLNGQQANCNGNYPHGVDEQGKKLPKGPYLERTTPAGHTDYPCNPYGLFDVHGNVWEWCEDWRNPGSSRVSRGGSWLVNVVYCRSSDRFHYSPDDRFSYVGFRLCR